MFINKFQRAMRLNSLILGLMLCACTQQSTNEKLAIKATELAFSKNKIASEKSVTVSINKPNIVWLVVEDMSPILPAYGDHTIETPAISALAAQGVKYTNVYSPSGVCSPSRAAIALGMYPSSIGANHMRTTSNTQETGLPKYEAVPPSSAKMLSQYLREQGYYTTNNLKTDYQFTAPKAAWHESGPFAHWRNRSENQPFFAVINFTTTHESGLFEPYGIRKIESRHYFSDDKKRIAQLPQHHSVKTTEIDTPIHLPKDTKFNIPPYLPDTPLVRRDMWKMYNNLAETDKQIGAVLQQLKEDDLYKDTIIVFYSDHGGPLPRQKRLIYDSGLKVPMIIRFPDGAHAGEVDEQLISFVDFAPTTLALAGINQPAHMHGQNFINNANKRRYIYAAADRFDGFTDTIRAVKNARYKYIRNYRTEQGYYLPVAYREKIPTMQELLRLRDAKQLTNAQAQWFRPSKPQEELFDTVEDPHELNNLAADPTHSATLTELRAALDAWLNQIEDRPKTAEEKLIKSLWQGAATQPVTAKPKIELIDGKIHINSNTPGAHIAYQEMTADKGSTSWLPYSASFPVRKGVTINAVAHRIGYQESSLVTYSQTINEH
ncbi:sulfatase family protein [Thalassotalea sp. PLHSN55]|uniref:sulfatase family protein n=1 Tax=Thalassotalea sp. PLHSN55 TaxID=3435888 RepID=UPI003F845D7F